MVSRACPRCKKSVEIPQPPPEKVQCAHCAAFIRLRVARVGVPKSNPELALSLHDFGGAPAPFAANPFGELDQGPADPASAPQILAPLRRPCWLLFGLFLAVAAAGAVEAYLIFGRPDPAKEQQQNNLLAKLDRAAEASGAIDFSKLGSGHNAAIDRGVSYLKQQIVGDDRLYYRSDLFPGNAHIGAAALAGLTLLECGVSPDDPAVQKALALVRDSRGQMHSTYTLSVAILFLDRLHQASALRPEDRQHIVTFAERLLATQDPGGFWGYGRGTRVETKHAERALAAADAQIRENPGYVNLSNSQFAALALWTAKHHGAKVTAPLRRVAQKAREKQEKNGAWSYDHHYKMAHTSTCAGLIFLAIGKSLEDVKDDGEPVRTPSRSVGGAGVKPGKKKLLFQDPNVEKGLAFLGNWVNHPGAVAPEKRAYRQKAAQAIVNHYQANENGEEIGPQVYWTMDYAFSGTIFGADSWGDLYLLWSLERVAMIYGLQKIGDREWHPWGSEIIVAMQQQDGSWQDRFPGVPDTCFALLFLKRANLAKYLTDKLRDMMIRAEMQSELPAPGKKE